jgi:hypothetical protein
LARPERSAALTVEYRIVEAASTLSSEGFLPNHMAETHYSDKQRATEQYATRLFALRGIIARLRGRIARVGAPETFIEGPIAA